jgi:hypothetical protein
MSGFWLGSVLWRAGLIRGDGVKMVPEDWSIIRQGLRFSRAGQGCNARECLVLLVKRMKGGSSESLPLRVFGSAHGGVLGEASK